MINKGSAADRARTAKRFDDDMAKQFMHRAIELSRKGMEAGDGGPFGAVIVHEGKIVGRDGTG